MSDIIDLRDNRIQQGVLWMVASTLLFVAMTSVIRYLGSNVPNIEAAFIRYLFGTLLTLPMLIRHWPRRMSPLTVKLYTIRSLVHAGGVMLWFFAMARIPVAEVTAIGYASPIFIAIGAGLFLGEKLRARRIIGIAFGFIGTMIILRPGFQELNLGQIAQLCATPLFAVSFLLAKKLTETESSIMIVGMVSLGCTIATLPGAILQWQSPTYEELGWLLLTAIFATAGHYAITRALQAAPITVTQPIGFLQLIWAIIVGYFLFGEAIDHFVLLGGAIVVGATTYISHRELQAARRERST
ncbi:EamA family transporter [Alphaproteobacteria bacterium 46_93_T64]|nr:EamA family transporter [Alphaproteobacteria bacterium 46_93_T64]